MDDLEEMLKLYPTMVLVSKSPMSWKGSLAISSNYTNCKINLAIRLTAPLFPRLDNVTVYFGGSIAFLFGAHFKSQIDLLIKRSESVPSFIQELIVTIEKLLCDHQDKQTICSFETDAREKLLKELNHVLSENSDVELSSTKNLSAIKLTMNDISMIVQPTVTSTGQNSWKIISSDLPEIPGYTITEKKSFTLKEIRNMFQRQVDMLEDVWDQLRRIDNYCWVTDPIQPKPYHLYRRVNLSPSLSFLLTLNPIDPTGYPKIKFLGVKSEVEKYRDMIQDEDAIEKWDLESSVYENLLTLLNIDEFPQELKTEKFEEEGGMVGDEECCICFSMELDNGELPDEICNNNKCRRHFHSICLFQWLQELAANKIIFKKIFGPCPNCGEELSCNVPST